MKKTEKVSNNSGIDFSKFYFSVIPNIFFIFLEKGRELLKVVSVASPGMDGSILDGKGVVKFFYEVFHDLITQVQENSYLRRFFKVVFKDFIIVLALSTAPLASSLVISAKS